MKSVKSFLGSINRKKLGVWTTIYIIILVNGLFFVDEINKELVVVAFLPVPILIFIGNISYFLQNPNDMNITFLKVAVSFASIVSLVFFVLLVQMLFQL